MTWGHLILSSDERKLEGNQVGAIEKNPPL